MNGYRMLPIALVAVCTTLWGQESETASAIVQVGVERGQTPAKLHGRITRDNRGTLNLPPGEPWGWVAVGAGEKPLRALEGLRSFTICGWARPIDLRAGSGGNRIAFNLQYDRAGIDLVHLGDGRLRLAVNEWPDGVRNDSSPHGLEVKKWAFFAVTYDGTRPRENVAWYLGGPGIPASLDRITSYNRGPTGTGSGVLTIGNYNPTIHRHGTDRQFRGQLHGIRILGSRAGSAGALPLAAIRKLQGEDAPDFSAPLPPALTARRTPPLRSSRQTDEARPGVIVEVPPPGTRPRIVATTDGEIDDRCSMVRFLLYANEWDIEGIVYSSSKFHWDGHSWAGTEWIEKDIALYASFYDTLKQHAPGFPAPEELRKKTAIGNIKNVGSMDRDTPGSDLIVRVLPDRAGLPPGLGRNEHHRPRPLENPAPVSRSDGGGVAEGHRVHHPRPGRYLPEVHTAQLARPDGAGKLPAVRHHRLLLGSPHSRGASRVLRPGLDGEEHPARPRPAVRQVRGP